MFTGIIETMATVKAISRSGSNISFLLSSSLAAELKVDQSLAHNGACLTVEAVEAGCYQVTAVAETLEKTNLGDWKIGDRINLERCLLPGSRLDGHFVQGHTDARGLLQKKEDLNGSWQFTIGFDPRFASLVIEKGSIALNGISLTIFDVTNDSFSVAVIPYTYEHTNLSFTEPGQPVNLEFDMLGKYINRWAETARVNNLSR